MLSNDSGLIAIAKLRRKNQPSEQMRGGLRQPMAAVRGELASLHVVRDDGLWIDAASVYWGNDASACTPLGRHGVI